MKGHIYKQMRAVRNNKVNTFTAGPHLLKVRFKGPKEKRTQVWNGSGVAIGGPESQTTPGLADVCHVPGNRGAAVCR